jgi:hypothetical protein
MWIFKLPITRLSRALAFPVLHYVPKTGSRFALGVASKRDAFSGETFNQAQFCRKLNRES